MEASLEKFTRECASKAGVTGVTGLTLESSARAEDQWAIFTPHSTDRVQFTVRGEWPFEVTITVPLTSVT